MYISKQWTCLTRPTLTDLNINGFYYYPLMVSLDRCDAPSRERDLNKTENVNSNAFDMITRVNE